LSLISVMTSFPNRFSLLRTRRGCFTLLELLIVIAILGILAGLLVPALLRSREQSKVTRCANNLRQIYAGFLMYLQDTDEIVFWQGTNVELEGMDWYVYGGRETNNPNAGQGNLFNKIVPRPVNPYVRYNLEVFRCPSDTTPIPWWDGYTHFEWVGNSYIYNAIGSPWPPYQTNGGFNTIRFSRASQPSRTVLFLDTSLVKATNLWHFGGRGNVCFADGHVEFIPRPSSADSSPYTWSP